MIRFGLRILFALAMLTAVPAAPAVAEDTAGARKEGEEEENYREDQVAGLNKSASKIFFSERPWTWSLWGEFNGVYEVSGEQDASSGDIELFFENLTRLTG